MTSKILVVDDEESIVELLKYNLEQAGFEVTTAMDGQKAFDLVRSETFDLVVLDLMIPGMDGLDVCKQMRINQITTPILMLTAKDEEFDKVLGLELGADDYMTKPFSPREVIARVRAILRRIVPQTSNQVEEANEELLRIGEVEILRDNYEVFVRKQPIELTPKEFELLLYLALHKGKVLTRDQLLNAVWNYEFVGDTRIVDVHISHLREKIEENTKKPTYIKTVRGLGYKLEEPPAYA